MKLDHEKLRKSVQDNFDATDQDAIFDAVDWALNQYEERKRISHDSIKAVSEQIGRVNQVLNHLQQASAALIAKDDDGDNTDLLVAGFLGAELDGTGIASPSFLNHLQQMMEACKSAIGHMEKGPMLLNGKKHTKRTRAQTRDEYLIPMLTVITIKYGRLDIPNDYDDLDTCCNFIASILEVAGIQAPSAGNTQHGESLQGRLRRQIKDAASLTKNVIT